jgi:prepilin-type N-terminal cleavage/methylation domain-containing protein
MNNKGFSLVELIVVVLIMAIIGVALAPQVIKWVNNSRVSSDIQTVATLKTNVQVALANEKAYAAVGDDEIVITLNNGSNATITLDGTALSGDSNDFAKKFWEVCGSEATFKATHCKQTGPVTIKYKSGNFTVTGVDEDDIDD